MLTRIGYLALVLLLAPAVTRPSMAELSSVLSPPASPQTQSRSVQSDSSPLWLSNYGGICYGFNFECTANVGSAEECCSSWVLCPNGDYVPPYEYYPYSGYEVLCW